MVSGKASEIGAEPSTSIPRRLHHNNKFPRVYTAKQQEHRQYDIGHMDVLKATKDTITFLVHNERELDSLTKLAKQFQEDEAATHKLWERAAAVTNERMLQDSLATTISGYPCYRNLAGTEQLMRDLVDRAVSVPHLEVTMTDIGDSYLKTQNSNEGHDIYVLKITGHGTTTASAEKGIMFAMMGLHAREYAPPELGARWAELLVEGYANGDAEIVSIVNHAEIHLVLQANPDGRHVAETDPDQSRRKNLHGDPAECGEALYGVDLNRNFPFQWGLDSGSSDDPCSDTYRGTSPASEPEVQAIVNYVEEIFPADQRKTDPEGQMDQAYPETARGIFIDVHSYGEIIIWPWGHVNQETANTVDLETLVTKLQHFNGYDYSGPNNGFSYAASGASDDWAYGTLGTAAMTLEVGNDFYQDCDYFENHVVPDNIPALFYAAKVSKTPYSTPKGPDIVELMYASSTTSTDGTSNEFSITASVSDLAWSSSTVSTSQQTLQEVRMYVDVHPDDVDECGNTPQGILLEGDYVGQGSGMATYFISGCSIKKAHTSHRGSTKAGCSGSATDIPSNGRHTVYFQATDSDGYRGPVTTDVIELNLCSTSNSTTFLVDKLGEMRDCSWLEENIIRFDYLCNYWDVFEVCPSTCQE